METFFFATLLDQNYISRAYVMLDSLSRNTNKKLHFFILALDNNVVRYFSEIKNVTVLEVADLEYYFPELLSAKNNRSKVEYLFTLSPFLPLYILQNNNINRITTLDADLFFLSDPMPYIIDLGNQCIGITQHGYIKDLEYLNEYGKFNVSFQSFPKTPTGIQCLKDWGGDCINYCGDKIDDEGRFGDQKYLDSWEFHYANVIKFPTPNIGLAPWNVKNLEIVSKGDKLFISENNIVFYHFHKFKLLNNRIFIHGLHYFHLDNLPTWLKKLYSNYWFELKNAERIKNDILITNSSFNDNRFTFKSFYKSLLQFAFGIEIFGTIFYFNFRKYLNFYLILKKKIWQPY